MYMQKNKFNFHKNIYLVFSFLEIQRKLTQTEVYSKFLNFVWKETTQNPQK